MFDFEGKVTLITGATGGLGGVVASVFRSRGANLALPVRDLNAMRDTFPYVFDSPDHFVLLARDAADPTIMQDVLALVIERFGRVDILVNCIGGYRPGKPLYELPITEFADLMSLNAHTVFVTSQATIPYMIERERGKIVNVAARAATRGERDLAAYASAKSAVVRLTESMSAEVRHHGINVNCVLPGTIDTSQNRQGEPGADYAKWVEPAAVADVICFLASDAARAVHGAAIPIDGLG